MKKILLVLLSSLVIPWVNADATPKEIDVQGRKLVSLKPAFTLTLPSEFTLIHFYLHENPGESSLTRVYFLVSTQGKQVEEMFILQIADKTNPQAEPMTAPPLKAYTEKRLYSKGKVKKGQLEIDYLTQLMAMNPDAPSLQPIIKKGFVIPARWTLQGPMARDDKAFFYDGLEGWSIWVHCHELGQIINL